MNNCERGVAPHPKIIFSTIKYPKNKISLTNTNNKYFEGYYDKHTQGN